MQLTRPMHLQGVAGHQQACNLNTAHQANVKELTQDVESTLRCVLPSITISIHYSLPESQHVGAMFKITYLATMLTQYASSAAMILWMGLQGRAEAVA